MAKKTKKAKKTAKKPAKKAAKKKVVAKKKAAPKKAATKRKPNPAFMAALQPSNELAAVVGAKPLPRTEVVKKLWAYIKKNGLQDKRNINTDDALKAIFSGKKVITMFEMNSFLSKHLTKI
jgi:upstream activation factor subunit UAF30